MRRSLLALGFLALILDPAIASASILHSVSPLTTGASKATASSSIGMTTPADGRLRGVDFSLTVTGVAWPASVATNGGVVPAAGNRIVCFAIRLTEPETDVTNDGLGSGTNTVALALSIRGSQYPIDLTGLDNELVSEGFGLNSVTGHAAYAAAVPIHSTSIDLVASEDGFSQSFDLWTLRRVGPSSVALYRDPETSTVVDSTSESASVTVTSSVDAAVNVDPTTLSSATLSVFSPDGANAPAPAGDAFLEASITSELPDSTPLNLDQLTPLAGSRVQLDIPGRAPIPATVVDPQQPDMGNSGLLDATYFFAVPGSITNATIVVLPGPDQASEGGLGTVGVHVTEARFAISFPPPPKLAEQPLPRWPTFVPTALPIGSDHGSSGSSSSNLPVILGCLFVLLLVAGFIAFDHRKGANQGASVRVDESPGTEDEEDDGATEAGTLTRLSDARPDEPRPGLVTVVDPLAFSDAPTVGIFGPVVFRRWRQRPSRRIVEELCCYLATHRDRPRSADEIGVALWPEGGGRPEPDRKTLRTYCSMLRAAVGPEHFPDATVGGYQLFGVATDWEEFRRLRDGARHAAGDDRIEFAREALELIRGEPFAGVTDGAYSWAFTEQLASTITAEVVALAHELATTLASDGRHAEAGDAARMGLRASPSEEQLWRDLLGALEASDARDALRRARADVRRILGDGFVDAGPH